MTMNNPLFFCLDNGKGLKYHQISLFRAILLLAISNRDFKRKFRGGQGCVTANQKKGNTMKWNNIFLLGFAALCMGGCGDPVVYRPVTDPTVHQADLPPKNITVRTFVGYTLSQSESFEERASAIAVLTSGREPNRGRCQFVFFVCGMSVIIELPIHGDVGAGAVEVKGKAWDPRGWDVNWTAKLQGDILEGTFDQPHDHGLFRLREVK